MPFSICDTPRRRENYALRLFGFGRFPCTAPRLPSICYARNATCQCQRLTSLLISRRPNVQHAELFPKRNGLVQDRFAGDMV